MGQSAETRASTQRSDQADAVFAEGPPLRLVMGLLAAGMLVGALIAPPAPLETAASSIATDHAAVSPVSSSDRR